MVNLRLVSFRRKGARIAEAGAMLNGGESILSIGGEVRRKKMTMLEIVNMTKSGGSTNFLKSIRERIKNGNYDSNQVVDASKVQVCAPIIPPRNVMCLERITPTT